MDETRAEVHEMLADWRDVAEQTLDGTLPYEETWRVNAENVLSLAADLAETAAELAGCRDQATQLRQALERVLTWPLPDSETVETYALPSWLAAEARAALASPPGPPEHTQENA